MISPIVVLDACVLVPASLRDTLLRSADAGMYELRLSDAIIEEVRRTIAKLSGNADAARRLAVQMRHYFSTTLVSGYESVTDQVILPDPDDRHVLAAAVVGQAELIVTENVRHFPRSVLGQRGIGVMRPDPFLVQRFVQDPITMARIVEEQASDLRRPALSVEEVLANLGRSVPQFAALVGEFLG